MSSREELINSYHGQKVLIDKISKGQFEKYNINEFLEYLKNITIFLEFPFAILMNDNKLIISFIMIYDMFSRYFFYSF